MKKEQVPTQVLGMWKNGWESYVKTLKTAEEQGDRMLDLTLQQSTALQEETRKLVNEWVSNSRNLSNSYLDAVEQNVAKLDELLLQPS